MAVPLGGGWGVQPSVCSLGCRCLRWCLNKMSGPVGMLRLDFVQLTLTAALKEWVRDQPCRPETPPLHAAPRAPRPRAPAPAFTKLAPLRWPLPSPVVQETREGMLASDATVIKLYGGVSMPDGKRLFISKLDGRFDRLANCECVAVPAAPRVLPLLHTHPRHCLSRPLFGADA
jgi:hypothetical protein